MPNLIETYARSTGLLIDRPWIKTDFYPVPLGRYITLSAGSGQAAKNYSSWQIVMDLLNPILSPLGISFVQLGDKDTPLFSGTYDLRGKMTVAQSAFAIKNAVAHIGNDSWSAHVAGAFAIPMVALYGTTDKTLHGPHWRGPKTVLLESHRHGKRPTFGAEGAPKSIDLIRPDEVAASVLSLLEVPHAGFAKTLYIGTNFPQTIIEVVPNSNPNLSHSPDIPFIARMDYDHNETCLQSILQTGRRVHIFTKAPINLAIINAFRAQILSYNHELDDTVPYEYLKILARLVPSRSFFTRTEDVAELARLRFHYFDVCSIEQLVHRTRARLIDDIVHYLNQPRTDIEIDLDNALRSGTLRYRTNKYLLSRDKIYLSYAHLLSEQSTPAIGANEDSVIDTETFWRETNHHMIYAQETNK